MKQLIERATRKAIEFERLLDRRMNQLVRTSGRPLEPLEVRNLVLRDIEQQVTPGPKGTQVFPYDDVTVELVAPGGGDEAPLDAVLGSEGGLEAAARKRLAERNCSVPPSFALRTVTLPQKPRDWRDDDTYRVRFRRLPQRDVTVIEEPTTLVLALRAGDQQATYSLTQPRIDIGRVLEVRDRDGRLVRQNAIVISEEHDPRGTVSRRHAHIRAIPEGSGRMRYLLYDDASSYGTSIVRNGQTIPVHPGTLGVSLRDGDELHFGEAAALVRIEKLPAVTPA